MYSSRSQFSKILQYVLGPEEQFQGFKSGVNLSALPKGSSVEIRWCFQRPFSSGFHSVHFRGPKEQHTNMHKDTRSHQVKFADLRTADQFTTFQRCLPLSIHSKGSSGLASIYLFFLSSKQWKQNRPPWPIGNLAISPVPPAPRWQFPLGLD